MFDVTVHESALVNGIKGFKQLAASFLGVSSRLGLAFLVVWRHEIDSIAGHSKEVDELRHAR